jgi:undecaprenyl-diphosphatase
MFSPIEALILGASQGIFEWLPVSSEGINTLAGMLFFDKSFQEALDFSIWLHLGTLFAAIIYFWKEIKELIKASLKLIKEKRISPKTKQENLVFFVLAATLLTAIVGLPLMWAAKNFEVPAVIASFSIGALLIVTGLLNALRSEDEGYKKQIFPEDGAGTGLFQAFSIIPGLSRSGLTVFYLLTADYSPKTSLKLSFLVSIPAIIGANLILNFGHFQSGLRLSSIIGAFVAFVFGLITIKSLIKIADRVNFAPFCFLLGGITILFSLLML